MLETNGSEITVLIFMAIALGMDAFSVCLGIGMQKLRLKRILWISFVIGSFHIVMPLLGILLGKMIAAPLESYAQLIGGVILFFIGAQMFFGAFKQEKNLLLPPIGFGLFLLALTVSMDSFTVGFGLGVSGFRVILTLFLFGLFSMILSCIALWVGRKVQGFLGRYSELLGGSILCGFGIHILFG
ncbi:manganese efflux pump MntP [Oceanobacillus sp. CAU 1775]